MGKTLPGGERTLILKVLKFFENEKRNKEFCLPIDQAINRTCMATGISKATLMRIKNEDKRIRGILKTEDDSTIDIEIKLPTPGLKRKPKSNSFQLDSHELCELKNIVEGFNNRNEKATLNKILDLAKRDLNFPGQKTYLRKVLSEKLGYRFRKGKHKKYILVQNTDTPVDKRYEFPFINCSHVFPKTEKVEVSTE